MHSLVKAALIPICLLQAARQRRVFVGSVHETNRIPVRQLDAPGVAVAAAILEAHGQDSGVFGRALSIG